MSRVQLALRVADLEGSIAFYSKLFGTTPAKRRPGYANFAIADPALKLVLIENPGHGGSLNHLGVEVERTADVAAATARLADAGLATAEEENVSCCYAVQDKVWVTGPGAERWEVYTVLADSGPELEGRTDAADGCDTGDGCCAPATQGAELLEVSALLEVPAAPSTACC